MKRSIFEMSADTRLLRQALAAVPAGGSIGYQDLSAAISKPVGGGTASLQSARNSLLRDEGIVFSPVRGVGLCRLTDAQIVAASAQDLGGLRRKAKKAARKITSVSDYSTLPAADQLRHTAALSVFTAVAGLTSESGVKRVEAAANGRSGELPIAETMKAFAT